MKKRILLLVAALGMMLFAFAQKKDTTVPKQNPPTQVQPSQAAPMIIIKLSAEEANRIYVALSARDAEEEFLVMVCKMYKQKLLEATGQPK